MTCSVVPAGGELVDEVVGDPRGDRGGVSERAQRRELGVAVERSELRGDALARTMPGDDLAGWLRSGVDPALHEDRDPVRSRCARRRRDPPRSARAPSGCTRAARAPRGSSRRRSARRSSSRAGAARRARPAGAPSGGCSSCTSRRCTWSPSRLKRSPARRRRMLEPSPRAPASASPAARRSAPSRRARRARARRRTGRDTAAPASRSPSPPRPDCGRRRHHAEPDRDAAPSPRARSRSPRCRRRGSSPPTPRARPAPAASAATANAGSSSGGRSAVKTTPSFVTSSPCRPYRSCPYKPPSPPMLLVRASPRVRAPPCQDMISMRALDFAPGGACTMSWPDELPALEDRA